MEICAPDSSLGAFRVSYRYVKPNREELIEAYEKWRDEQLFVCGVSSEGNIIWWRAAKRGTYHYVQKIQKKVTYRIEKWLDQHKDLNYWKFLTLTVPETEIQSLFVFRVAWNRFLTNLRKRHPQMRLFRVYELQERGSVHMHAIIWGIKWIPVRWLLKNWKYGRPNIQRPKSIKGIIRYLSGYFRKSFADSVVQSFMWYYGVRQWACNFPCPDIEVISNFKVWGIGVCVLRGEAILWNSIKCNVTSFLRVNGLYNKANAWTLKNITKESGVDGIRKTEGVGAYEMIAGMLKYNWLSYRHQGLHV